MDIAVQYACQGPLAMGYLNSETAQDRRHQSGNVLTPSRQSRLMHPTSGAPAAPTNGRPEERPLRRAEGFSWC
jgi:hypothetical protein